jgi:hypothetical protein
VSGAGVRKLLPKLLKAARRRLDLTIKNHRGQTIVQTLTESVHAYCVSAERTSSLVPRVPHCASIYMPL